MEQPPLCLSVQKSHWIKVQNELKKKLITYDDFPWELSYPSSSASASSPSSSSLMEKKEVLKYIGGLDISFSKEDPLVACGTLVVMEFRSSNIVYDDFFVSRLDFPYIAGFLAFREVPILLRLIEKMKSDAHPFYPQLLMVDGNGLLHPRGFGLACHLGVLADIPTIGVGKNLHHVEGLNHSEVRERLKNSGKEESVFLTGNTGGTLGVAVRSTSDAMKPIFVSIGHRISLPTALKIVTVTCKYRVPEPIRQADIRSREYLRKHTLVPSTPEMACQSDRHDILSRD